MRPLRLVQAEAGGRHELGGRRGGPADRGGGGGGLVDEELLMLLVVFVRAFIEVSPDCLRSFD